jgi:Protein of unknown function (DUF2752)
VLRLQREAAGGSTPRSRRLALPAAVGAVGLLATGYVAAVDPNASGHYPVCPTYALAGIYCPGCGMLRATHDLLHGDLAGALARNPLSPLVLAAILVLYGLWVYSRASSRALAWTPSRLTPWLLAAAFVSFTVARNVPGWTWLSPA